MFSPCDAGYPDPEVVWFKDDQSIRESRHFQIDYDEDGNCSLIISDVCGDDDAKYTCKAVNSLGEATCTAELIVETMEEGEGEGEEEEEEEEEWNKAREKQFLSHITKTISLKLKKSKIVKTPSVIDYLVRPFGGWFFSNSSWYLAASLMGINLN